MTQKLFIHFDPEGDYLEVRFGTPTASYFKDRGDDVFERRDEQTDDVVGYSFFNVEKRKKQQPRDIEVALPTRFA